MSFLAWMFGLGGLAIAFPLLFHLIRRMPRGKQTFSSLMFLRQSPPRITRKSRLENWLLLLLRSLAVVLLALAFMRPFIPLATQVTPSIAKRVAILLDTSASMQRSDQWPQAVRKVEELLNTLAEDDDIALLTFDARVNIVLPFEQPAQQSLTLARKKDLIRDELRQLKPTWSKTDLGNALIATAEHLEDSEVRRDLSDLDIQIGSQIFVVTDLQEGVELAPLTNYRWPKNVLVEIHRLQPETPGNAYALLLEDQNSSSDLRGTRVRLINSKGAETHQFSVRWLSDDSSASDQAVTFNVPPGSNQTLPVPRLDANSTELLVSGDAATFDNRLFVAPLVQQQITVGYLGDDDADDVDGLQYYMTRAFVETPTRKITVIDDPDELAQLATDPQTEADWWVVSRKLEPPEMELLNEHIARGNQVLIVLTSVEMTRSLESLLGSIEVNEVSRENPRDYRMLGQIDFQHPLFKPLSGPQYNDFTKIRFWRHRAVLNPGETSEVIARFDNGDPAIWFPASETGTLLVFASGWNPDDSQLGLSTKFVPLMMELSRQAVGESSLAGSWSVDDAIELPQPTTAQPRKIVAPDGREYRLQQDEAVFNQTDHPGVYQLHQDGQQLPFAVNLHEMESRTAPLDPEHLAAYQVRLGNQPTHQDVRERLQRASIVQIENRQKIWKWAIVVVLFVLIFETILAGRRQVNQQQLAEVTA